MREIPNNGTRATYRMKADASRTITLSQNDLRTEVFSTPSMILAMELAAKELLRPYLEEDEDSVGMNIEVEHLAPTPKGETVEATAVLMKADGKLFDFEILARDTKGEIGKGHHRRAIVRMDKFRASLEKRTAQDTHRSPRKNQYGQLVSLEFNGPVATLRLQREHSLNAINEPMTNELEAALDQLEKRHPAISICLVEGAGRAFCAGEDIKENAKLDGQASLELAARRGHICRRLANLPQIAIAKVRGPCMGGGLALAMSCDLICASHDARFSMPEIKLGWPPAYSMELLIERIGRFAALELVLTGRSLNAHQAIEMGLVWKVCPPARIEAELKSFLGELGHLTPLALTETKRLVRSLGTANDPATLQAQLEAYGRCRATEEAAAGMKAFLRK